MGGIAAEPLPSIAPMKAVSAEVPTDDGWAFEVKWDGMRTVVGVDDGVHLTSTTGQDVTGRFPELGDLAAHLAGHRAVLDGEVVAFDDGGRTDFGRLQPRMQARTADRVAHLRGTVPITLVLFDLLHLDGHDTLALPYADRRRLLAELVEPARSWIVPGHRVGDGPALLAAAARRGLEGIVAKRLDGPYLPGRRSSTWRKCKVRRRQEVVVGGWSPGQGARSSSLGSLLVGVHDPDAPGRPLRFAGGVGTGFTAATLADLRDELVAAATDRCPFDPPPPAAVARTARWVEPRLVVEVAFAAWTADGRLRHASHLGRRTDKAPSQVVREPDGSAGDPSGADEPR